MLTQTYADLELIVVDDGSTDRSIDVARRAGDGRLRVVVQANAGVAAARNRGAAVASGEYLAFLDQDDLWAPEKLERQLPCLQGGTDVGLVYSDCLLIGEDGTPLGRWGERYPLLRGRLFERLIVESVVPISTVLMPRALFEAVGGFQPRYRYVEDLDLLLRVAAGHAIEVVDRPLARYRLHPGSTSRTLGIEVAAGELVALCEWWMARDAGRRRSVERALAAYLYTAGKTAFYQGRVELARGYLADAARRDRTLRARLFGVLARRSPRLLLGAHRLVQRLRGRAAATPGTFTDRFA